jgi:hypothetical protein
MAKFQKAAPQQARLKVSLYGPPGSGKTFTTLLMAEGLARVRGKRIAFVDTERGTDFYAQKVPARKVHPEAFDFDALYTKGLAEVVEAVRSLDPAEHGIVVIDSISQLWDAAIEAYKGKMTGIGGIPMPAWGAIKKPYKKLVSDLIGSEFDVFILGRQKNMFDSDEDGEMKKTGVGMRAEGETQYEPHINARMEASARSADCDYLLHVEKDRTGVLSGRAIKNPSFATIEPLLPLLGSVQAPVEDEDERIAKDSELMETTAKSKDKARADKSIGIFREFQPAVMGAKDLGELGVIHEKLKKNSRYLLEEHAAALREMYRSRRESLVNETAPEAA